MAGGLAIAVVGRGATVAAAGCRVIALITLAFVSEPEMASQGRGRGVRRNFEAGKEARVGARGREGEEEERRRRREGEEGRGGGGSLDSPIPEGFVIGDLMDMVDRLEVVLHDVLLNQK